MRIDVTDVDTVLLVKTAYSLSVPRGLGILHFQGGGLSDEDAKQCIDPDGSVYMDYVHGRGCKFHVHVENGRKYINSPWYDHTDEELGQLLTTCGVSEEAPAKTDHGVACACANCEAGRAGITN